MAEVNNFEFDSHEETGPQNEREVEMRQALAEHLATLSTLRTQRDSLHALLQTLAHGQEKIRTQQELHETENSTEATIRSVTDLVTEATLNELLDFNEARDLLFAHAIPVAAELKSEYDAILARFGPGTKIDLRERANQPKPARLTVSDTPALYLAPERGELSMRAAIYLPIVDEDGTFDSTTIYPRRERDTGNLTTPGIDVFRRW